LQAWPRNPQFQVFVAEWRLGPAPGALYDCLADHVTEQESHMRTWMLMMMGMLSPAWALAGSVDLNSADAATLARELDGIGLARAQAIIEYREKNGRFHSVDQLLNVKGIGPQVLEKNRGNLQVGTPEKR